MTNKEFEAVLKNMENSEQLLEELRGASDEEAAMEIIHRYGLNVSMNELTALCFEEDVLSEAQLDVVAGGRKCTYDSWLHWLLWKIGQFIGIHNKNECPLSQF